MLKKDSSFVEASLVLLVIFGSVAKSQKGH